MRSDVNKFVCYLVCFVGAAVTAAKASSPAADWAEGENISTGANALYYNRDAQLLWKHKMGDWLDANSLPQGEKPLAIITIPAGTIESEFLWDITNIAKGWLNETIENRGLFLRVPASGRNGTASFHSRETDHLVNAPALVLDWSSGKTDYILPSRDVHLDPTTHKSQGKSNRLRAGGGKNALIGFALKNHRYLADRGELKKASLSLTTTGKQFGNTTVGIYLPAASYPKAAEIHSPGIAEQYPGDQGISDDSRVVFAENFETLDWDKNWSELQKSNSYELINEVSAQGFFPLSQNALKVTMSKGTNLGLNLRYLFAKETGGEPEQIYFRYYLRLSKDWRPDVVGGKLPGLAGTYNVAGWGGRRSDGYNGWSTRGQFLPIIQGNNPLAGLTAIGNYAYYADMPDRYGSSWIWAENGRGLLTVNRWYAIEQFVRLNDPGQPNGVLTTWVDGKRAFHKTDIMYRRAASLKIESVWMNVYHGGTQPAPRDITVYIDNVVIADDYIGPMH